MTKLTTLILTTTLAAISHTALAAQSAQAPDIYGPNQLLVRYADLDLTRPEGAALLYHRLHNAAEAVCSSIESRELARMAMFRKCVSDAMGRAVTQVDRPGLSTYYRGKVPSQNAVPFAVASNNGVSKR